MRIAIIGPAWPLRGGIANFNEALARALQKEGHQVRLFSFSLQYPGFLFPGKTQFESGATPADLDIDTCINSVNPISWRKCSKKIKAYQPDLVLVRFWLPFMGPALGSICKSLRKKIPVIAITDNVIPHEGRPGDRVFTSYFLKQCHGFIAMSQSVLSDLDKFNVKGPKKLLAHPIYNIFGEAVDRKLALEKLGLDPDYNYLLFFGIIRKYKGLDILLEALSRVDAKKYRIKLLIAGEFYDDDEPYKKFISDHQLEQVVVLHDHFIPSDEVKYYFSAASLVTQTYRTATQSGVTQIAYHFGKPMLVTDVGGLAETVPHGKVGYVTSTQPSVIASSIEDFFLHHREEEMIKNTQLESKRFEWSVFTQGIMDLLAQVEAR